MRRRGSDRPLRVISADVQGGPIYVPIYRRRGGFWPIATVLLLLTFIGVTVYSFVLNNQLYGSVRQRAQRARGGGGGGGGPKGPRPTAGETDSLHFHHPAFVVVLQLYRGITTLSWY